MRGKFKKTKIKNANKIATQLMCTSQQYLKSAFFSACKVGEISHLANQFR